MAVVLEVGFFANSACAHFALLARFAGAAALLAVLSALLGLFFFCYSATVSALVAPAGGTALPSCWWAWVRLMALFQSLAQVISCRVRPRLAPRTPFNNNPAGAVLHDVFVGLTVDTTKGLPSARRSWTQRVAKSGSLANRIVLSQQPFSDALSPERPGATRAGASRASGEIRSESRRTNRPNQSDSTVAFNHAKPHYCAGGCVFIISGVDENWQARANKQ